MKKHIKSPKFPTEHNAMCCQIWGSNYAESLEKLHGRNIRQGIDPAFMAQKMGKLAIKYPALATKYFGLAATFRGISAHKQAQYEAQLDRNSPAAKTHREAAERLQHSLKPTAK